MSARISVERPEEGSSEVLEAINAVLLTRHRRRAAEAEERLSERELEVVLESIGRHKVHAPLPSPPPEHRQAEELPPAKSTRGAVGATAGTGSPVSASAPPIGGASTTRPSGGYCSDCGWDENSHRPEERGVINRSIDPARFPGDREVCSRFQP